MGRSEPFACVHYSQSIFFVMLFPYLNFITFSCNDSFSSTLKTARDANTVENRVKIYHYQSFFQKLLSVFEKMVKFC